MGLHRPCTVIQRHAQDYDITVQFVYFLWPSHPPNLRIFWSCWNGNFSLLGRACYSAKFLCKTAPGGDILSTNNIITRWWTHAYWYPAGTHVSFNNCHNYHTFAFSYVCYLVKEINSKQHLYVFVLSKILMSHTQTRQLLLNWTEHKNGNIANVGNLRKMECLTRWF